MCNSFIFSFSMTSQMSQTALSAQDGTDLVLKITTYLSLGDALVDNGEAEMMAVGGGAVACQGTDTGHRAGLCMNIALRLSAFHAIF